MNDIREDLRELSTLIERSKKLQEEIGTIRERKRELETRLIE